MQVLHKAPKLLDVAGDLGGAADVLLLEVSRAWMLLSSISRKQGLEGQGLGAGARREVQSAWTFWHCLDPDDTMFIRQCASLP